MFLRQLVRGKTYVLSYKYVPDMVQKRVPYRDNHLKLLKEFEGKGLLLAGAFQNPIDSAIFMFDSEERVVKEFIKLDPYNANNLVEGHTIREIMIAAGSLKTS